MKRIALLLAVGVPCFLTGVIVGYLWFHHRLPAATQSDIETGTDSTFAEAKSEGGGAAATGTRNARAAKFAALDSDHDGKLSLSEFGAGRAPAEAAKWFGRRDADHDGFISKQEFLPFSARSETE
jgi:hypothetical protein